MGIGRVWASLFGKPELLKFYLYVSQTKIDMLYKQFGEPPHTTTKKVSAMVHGVGGEVSQEQRQSDDAISKLPTVLKRLRRSGQIEDISGVDPMKDYISAELPMRSILIPEDDPKVVYFGGTIGNLEIGLGGSIAHLVGAAPEKQHYGHSPVIYLSSILRETASLNSSNTSDVMEAVHYMNDLMLTEQDVTLVGPDRGSSRDFYPSRRVEFVAKWLLSEALRPNVTIVLGSPLYVALAD